MLVALQQRLRELAEDVGADLSPLTKRLIRQLSTTAKGWVIRRFSAAATGNLFELQDENGNVIGYFSPTALLQTPGYRLGADMRLWAIVAGQSAIRSYNALQLGGLSEGDFDVQPANVGGPQEMAVVIPQRRGRGLDIRKTDALADAEDFVRYYDRLTGQKFAVTKDGFVVFGDGSVQSTAQQKVVLTTDRVNNNATANTIADITGLSFPVVAGRHYDFEFVIRYSAAAVETGARFSINGPAGEVGYHTVMTSAAASGQPVVSVSHYTAYNLPTAAGTFTPYLNGNLCIIRGVVSPTANGNVVARFASEIASSAITVRAARSYVNYSLI